MVGGKAAGYALELMVALAELASERLDEGGLPEKRPDLRWVCGHTRADLVEHGRLRVPHPTAHEHLARREVEVTARSGWVGQGEARTEVRLVRGLVFGEADVAVDPEGRSLGIGLERDSLSDEAFAE